jgi:nitrite reductase/ring-hydroxylating ferredoxin subunit
MCQTEGCKTLPSYNVDGETKPLYCLLHREDDMVNVINKKCAHEGCKTRPSYNVDGETKGLYCVLHREDGMVDVVSRKCAHEDCEKQPSYNVDGETKRLYCLIHKKDGMVNVINKKCAHEGCKTRSSYNVDGETKPLYCLLHRKDGMVDVISKRCAHEGCKTQPSYNVDGETKGLYCLRHKKDGMVDVIHKMCMCKTYLCGTRATEKYEGYCLFCYIHMFPDRPVSRNYKTKEIEVVEYIKTCIPQHCTCDKIIQGGCSKRRPDILIDLIDQVIIVEIDENQHIDYDCSCENKRLMEISRDLAYRPTVFIRFNPDEYDEITSCWGINSKGFCVVRKSKKKEWCSRLKTLEETIKYWIEHRTEKTVEVVHLFYDTNLI